MSYLHIPNASNGDQRLGKVTKKTAHKGAETTDLTQSGTYTYAKNIQLSSGPRMSVSRSTVSRNGVFNGGETVGFSSVSGILDNKFKH